MNNTMINKILKFSIITGLALISFIPLYVANNMFFPFITGKAFAFRIIVEIVAALWLILVLREKGSDVSKAGQGVAPRINYLTISVTVFTLIVLITDLLGYNPLRSIWSNFERSEGWITIIHLWAYFIVLSSVFGNSMESDSIGKKHWFYFLNVALLAGTITVFYGLFQSFGWLEVHQSATRVDASLGNSAYMAVYMIFNAFIAAYLLLISNSWKFIKNGKNSLMIVYAIIFALSSYILFLTQTRGSILGWTAGLMVFSGIYAIFGRSRIEGGIEKGQSRMSRYIAGGLILLLILLGVILYKSKDTAFVKNNQVLNRLASISLSDTKTQARQFIWPMAIKSIFSNGKSSVLGIGQENFNYIFNKDYTPLMYGHEQWFDRAHSVFLDWLVAGGLLGLISYLALYIIAAIYVFRSKLTIGQKSILLGLLVAYGVHNVFVFDNQTSYVMFFTVLAFISAIASGKTYKILGHSDKKLTENGEVIRDYIYVPIVIVALIPTLYFVNVRNVQANLRLMDAMRSCQGLDTLSPEPYMNALKLNQTTANQEIREQLISCAGNAIRSDQVPEKTKISLYSATKIEIENQIKETPNDARIYVIASSFYNSIGDFNSALPLINKARELTPGKQAVKFDLAMNYLNTDRPKEAVEIAKDAYDSAPEYDMARLVYAITLINNGEDKKAHEIFGDDEKIFTDQRVISSYMKRKEFSKVIDIYKKMVAKNPDDAQTNFYLAATYFAANQIWNGTNELKKIQEKFPQTKPQIDSILKEINAGKNPFLDSVKQVK